MTESTWLAPAASGLAALLGVLLGGWINARVATRRLRFDSEQATRQLHRQRREDARPTVGQLADLFTELDGRAAPHWAHDGPRLEDVFGDWWPDFARKLRRRILEVPDPLTRERLSGAVAAAELSWALPRYGIGESQRRIIGRSAEIGAEVAGAWLREDEPSEDALEQLRLLTIAVDNWETDQIINGNAAAELGPGDAR